MPAESAAQQAAAAIARQAKKGKIPMSRLRGASKQMAKGMSVPQLGHLAKTKTKGLPEKKEKVAMDMNKLKALLKSAAGNLAAAAPAAAPQVATREEALTAAYADGVFSKCAELNLDFEQALEVWNTLAAAGPEEAPAK